MAFSKDERPLAFEDLPNDVLGVVVRKLEDGKDRLRLTQASPSVRRLSSGPRAVPGVLGALDFSFDGMTPEKSIELYPPSFRSLVISYISFNLAHPNFYADFAAFLAWLRRKSKAFSCIGFSPFSASAHVPDVVVSILRVLYETSFQGHLELVFSDMHETSIPIFQFLCSSCPSDSVSLSINCLDLHTAAELFKSLPSFREVDICEPVGRWSPDFFARSKDLHSFVIHNFSRLANFALPTAASLKRLELDSRPASLDIDVPSLFSPALSSNSLQDLRILKLGMVKNLPQLSVLSSLGSLVSYSACLCQDVAAPEVPDPATFSLTLPHLERLILTLNLTADATNHEASFSVAFPLNWLSCPEARLLKLNVTNIPEADSGLEGRDITLTVGSLASFPSLRCLCLEAGQHFLYNARHTILRFKVRTDFRETPDLAFFSSSAQGCSLPPPPRVFSLPVTKFISAVHEAGQRVGIATRLECGDKRVLEELEDSPDFPWREDEEYWFGDDDSESEGGEDF